MTPMISHVLHQKRYLYLDHAKFHQLSTLNSPMSIIAVKLRS